MKRMAYFPSPPGPYDPSNITELAAAILRNAVHEDGPGYMLDPCARWWCDVLGMDARFLFRESSRIRRELRVYKPRRYCILRPPRNKHGRFVKAS